MKQRRKLHWTPDACAFTVYQFRDWLYKAEVGERCLYHIGQIKIDQGEFPHLINYSRYVMLMSDYGAVRINQARSGMASEFQYYASRLKFDLRSIPESVGTCAVGPDIFIALGCVYELQSSTGRGQISTRHMVKEALACRDSDIDKIYEEMYRCGYIIKEGGKRIVVTDKGMEVLI